MKNFYLKFIILWIVLLSTNSLFAQQSLKEEAVSFWVDFLKSAQSDEVNRQLIVLDQDNYEPKKTDAVLLKGQCGPVKGCVYEYLVTTSFSTKDFYPTVKTIVGIVEVRAPGNHVKFKKALTAEEKERLMQTQAGEKE